MPRGDATGPRGAGPMTGRAAGFCAGYGAPGFASGPTAVGRMHCFGGGGRGWRHVYYATGQPGMGRGGLGWMPASPLPPEGELATLKAHAQRLGDELDGIKQRMAEIEGKAFALRRSEPTGETS